MQDAIARLREKLDRLRDLDRDLRIFGANQHHYELGPCLSERRVADIEATYQISLPDEYRAFLLHTGNGGAGPDYGVYSIEDSLNDNLYPAQYFSRPFPHSAHWNLDVSQFQAELGEDTGLAAYEAEYVRDEHFQGALPINTAGCTHFYLIVLNGPERGNLWYDGRGVDAGILPLPGPNHPEARMGFFAWYEAWLDHSIAHARAGFPRRW